MPKAALAAAAVEAVAAEVLEAAAAAVAAASVAVAANLILGQAALRRRLDAHLLLLPHVRIRHLGPVLEVID